MSLTALLQAANSPDNSVRNRAEQEIQQTENHNPAIFFVSLAAELRGEDRADEVRQMAGVLIKNALYSQTNEVINDERKARWASLDPTVRQQVRESLLATLSSESHLARHSAAQAIAKIAGIELPIEQWVDLIPQLMALGSLEQPSLSQRYATLETVGFMCEELQQDCIPQEQTNGMLGMVIGSMAAGQDPEIRRVAAVALKSVLGFAEQNFDAVDDRNNIMSAICELTTAPELPLRVAAIDCIVEVSDLYYQHLGDYMEALYNITFNMIRTEDDALARAALEMWNSIATQEVDLHEKIAEAEAEGTEAPPCANYILSIKAELVNVLHESMLKQEDDQDIDSFNLSMASGFALGQIAQCIGDEIIELVMPWITADVNSDDWRRCEAAVIAFGMILPGVSADAIGPHIDNATMLIISKLNSSPEAGTFNPNELVRDSAAWTVGRIIQDYFNAINLEAHFGDVMNILLLALQDVPRVAANVCYCIHNVADAIAAMPEMQESSVLSGQHTAIIRQLLDTSEREDHDVNGLRVCAYAAVSAVVTGGAEDTIEQSVALVPGLLERLSQSLKTPCPMPSAAQEQQGLQLHLASLLQCIAQKAGANIKPHAPSIMEALIQVSLVEGSAATEDAILAMGSIAQAVDEEFVMFMDTLAPMLVSWLQQTDNFPICSAALGLAGDTCRAIGERMAPLVPEIIDILLKNLEDRLVDRNIKPGLLSLFAELGLAVPPPMGDKLVLVMTVIDQASKLPLPEDRDDEESQDLYEFIVKLRRGVGEAYCGIVQGFNPPGEATDSMNPTVAPLQDYVPNIINFIHSVAEQMAPLSNLDEDEASLLKVAADLMGDLGSAFRKDLQPVLNRSMPWVNQALKQLGQQGEDHYESAEWAASMLVL